MSMGGGKCIPAYSRWVGLHHGLLASQGVLFLPFPPGIPGP